MKPPLHIEQGFHPEVAEANVENCEPVVLVARFIPSDNSLNVAVSCSGEFPQTWKRSRNLLVPNEQVNEE